VEVVAVGVFGEACDPQSDRLASLEVELVLDPRLAVAEDGSVRSRRLLVEQDERIDCGHINGEGADPL
jgi:hypothetical protein